MPEMEYGKYLHLEKLLDLQTRESARVGRPVHDEMLFIVVHQTYELWFKQILFEIDAVDTVLAQPRVEDVETARIVNALTRILTILKLLIQQVDVLETMTPMDFLEFRDLLIPASGFQSLQFRLVEARLGLKRERRPKIGGNEFDHNLPAEDRPKLKEIESRPSLVDRLDAWLARTPFLNMEGFDFEAAYPKALNAMLTREKGVLEKNPQLSDEQRATQIAALDEARTLLDGLFDEKKYAELRAKDKWTLSRKALQAALFINLYRDEPVLQIPFRLLARLMDIDETITIWRMRHALMAQRMIGSKVGTGGSSGHGYLRATTVKNRIFDDLFAITTFLLPRADLPPLPEGVRKAMRFHYGT